MTTDTAISIDDIRTLLPDWRRHLKAKNRTPATIASYQAVGLRSSPAWSTTTWATRRPRWRTPRGAL
jgi:hypothetical protein